MKNIFKNILMVTLILSFTACDKMPEPISYGNDSCDNCRMTISDSKFGAELITDKGKIYKFDSAECLAAFEQNVDSTEINSRWVTNFLSPKEFIKAEEALYLVSDKIKSPMGLNIASFSNQKSLEEIRSTSGGKVLNWKEVHEYVRNEWK